MKKQSQAGPYVFLIVLVFAIAFIAMNFDNIREKLGFKKEVQEEIHVEAPIQIITTRTLDLFKLKNDIIELIENLVKN